MAFKALPGFNRGQYQAVKNPVFSLTENKSVIEDRAREQKVRNRFSCHKQREFINK